MATSWPSIIRLSFATLVLSAAFTFTDTVPVTVLPDFGLEKATVGGVLSFATVTAIDAEFATLPAAS
jgi:hypothetical protein